MTEVTHVKYIEKHEDEARNAFDLLKRLRLEGVLLRGAPHICRHREETLQTHVNTARIASQSERWPVPSSLSSSTETNHKLAHESFVAHPRCSQLARTNQPGHEPLPESLNANPNSGKVLILHILQSRLAIKELRDAWVRGGR